MLKKNVLLIAVLTLLTSGLMAQDAERDCGTMDVHERLLNEDPNYEVNMAQIEAFTQEFITNNAGESRSVVTIPVVFHVVWNNASENISDAQVLSQLDILNEDFRRLNDDVSETLPAFSGIAADTEIEFCLATVDPNGNPTTGITRTNTFRSSFNADDKVKFDSDGGKDAWPRDEYLNIWICDLGGGLLGYAQFPGGPASTDGVVCDYLYFGNTGVATAPFDLGRTCTHEVGHWLNLRHIWGDGGCGASDFVADTPDASGPNYGCPLSSTSCGSIDNVQNYMDYTNDACMNMFTQGQGDRMQALFAPGGSRFSILSSPACGGGGGDPTCDAPTGLTTTDITTNSAVLNWGSVAGAVSYDVRGREVGSATWLTGSTAGTTINYTGLTPGTDYEWQVQTVCAGSTSGYTTSTLFTSSTEGGGGCTDFGEPNESGNASAPTITPGVTYEALIASSGDDDWYKFKTSGSVTNIRVTVSSMPADYDVELYNRGTFVDVSENAGTSDEQIIWNTSSRGWRLVHVYGWAGAFDDTDCYELLVETSASSFRTDGSAIVVEEEMRSGIMGLYPNPASDMVSVVYHNAYSKQDVQISVFNVMGQMTYSESTLAVEGDNLVQFDVSQFVPGVYVVDVFDGKSHFTKNLVVE